MCLPTWTRTRQRRHTHIYIYIYIIHIGQCNPNPCPTGIQCVDLVNDYFCECQVCNCTADLVDKTCGLLACSSGSIPRLSLVWHSLCGGVLFRRVSVSENDFVKFRSRTYRCRTFTKDLLCVVWLLPDVWVFFK